MKLRARRLCSVLISLVMILGMLPYGQTAMAATYKGFKADDGNGNGILEGYMSLVDNDMNSKWYSGKKTTPPGENQAYWWVDFHAENAINVNGYSLTTGNDNAECHGRNPKSWILKAKLEQNGNWETIATRSNDTTLEDKNFTTYNFDLDKAGSYKYFRFLVSESRGADGIQLTELTLNYTEKRKITKLEITNPPDKTEYTVGERFNPAGMVVMATFDGGKTEEVTDYTINPGGQLTTSHNKVTLSFTSGGETRTATQNITVTVGNFVALNEINFPDANFRGAVWRNFDIDDNKVLSEGEIAEAKELFCDLKNITTLNGVEYLTALERLSCKNNKLDSLGVSANTALRELDCAGNNLSSLDVSNNTSLKYLYCSYNKLDSLNVSANTALESLFCGNNNLSSLDVSKNTLLEKLDCQKNKLTYLDLSDVPGVVRAFKEGNEIGQNPDYFLYYRVDGSGAQRLGVDKNVSLKLSRALENVAATITLPVTGSNPVRTGTVNNTQEVTVKSVRFWETDANGWVEDDETFSTGQKLRIYIEFEPEKYFDNNTKVTVNGRVAKQYIYKNVYYIDYIVSASASAIPGDINNDGNVNAMDKAILNRYLAGWEGYAERILNWDAADIDRSGNVDGKDKAILNRYLAGWEGYDKYFK